MKVYILLKEAGVAYLTPRQNVKLFPDISRLTLITKSQISDNKLHVIIHTPTTLVLFLAPSS